MFDAISAWPGIGTWSPIFGTSIDQRAMIESSLRIVLHPESLGLRCLDHSLPHLVAPKFKRSQGLLAWQ